MARTKKKISAHAANDLLLLQTIVDQVRANENRSDRFAIENTNHTDRPTSFRTKHPRRTANSLPAKLLQPSHSPGYSEFLLPATRLYTHFLEHALPIFHCLIHTVPKVLARKKTSDLRIWIFPEPLLALTKEQKESTLHYMGRIGEAVDWDVHEAKEDAGLNEADDGMTTMQCDRPLLRWGLSGWGSTITSSRKLVQAVEDAARAGDDTAGEKWHSFCLARLWLHEMSHAVVNAVLPSNTEKQEVFLGTNASTSEVGFEVEQRVFGGCIHNQEEMVPWKGKVCLEEWPDSRTLADLRRMGIQIETRGSSRALTKEWIVLWKVESEFWERMFEEEFWLQDSIMSNPAALHPEKSVGIMDVFRVTTVAEKAAIAGEMRSMGYAEVEYRLWARQASADDTDGIEAGTASEKR
ncbi:unnamed protein product [Zymoseptoria tritici ST99CH_3D7]|uniref:Uncharacterized protein n=1 Tax=Zymoseptoria tritici (strain ST99CH_3D7) TaxID=1276538 RepID=A0A1X7RH49_ZYMT9|nr:unnamed protein product [Zymoseptoria tritici ST99CH_3D7]